jgi:hypothetical protein
MAAVAPKIKVLRPVKRRRKIRIGRLVVARRSKRPREPAKG